MAPRNVARRRAVTVLAVCTAVVALPVGLAAAAAPSATPGSIISINGCGDGLTVTIGGGSILTVGLPGDDCPTPSPSASASASPFPSCTLPPPPTTPPPSTPPPSTPAPSISHFTTTPPPAPSTPPPPSPQAAAQPIPTPPAPSPSPTTPKPTPERPTPRAATSTVMIVPSAQTFHTVPFKRLSTVLIVFIIAIVPVSIARIRHRRRG